MKTFLPNSNQSRRRWLLILSLAMLFTLGERRSTAQALHVRPAPTARPRPLIILTGSLTLTASPSTVNFTLLPAGQASGDATVSLTTAWTGVTGLLIVLNVYGYFSSTTQALVNSTNSAFAIPSSSVSASVSGMYSNLTGFNAFTQVTPFGGASGLNLASVGSLLTLGTDGSFTDVLNLKIDLSSQPTLPAGTYAGSLNLVAQAL